MGLNKMKAGIAGLAALGAVAGSEAGAQGRKDAPLVSMLWLKQVSKHRTICFLNTIF